jgi:hypothetical protein
MFLKTISMTKKTNVATSKKATAKKATAKKATAKKATVTRASKTSKTKTTNNRKSVLVVKSRTQVSVENGIKILEMAIKGNLSLSEASRQNSFGRNYLSDVKAKIKENYKSKRIDRETYRNFSDLLKTYNRL